ncbi:MAG: hypothetical protein KGZ85_18130 [Ignavibacterium sp.]|nr:hypothetical protein [Ignavibacterium sp.]
MKYNLVYKSRTTPFFPGYFNLSNYDFKKLLNVNLKQEDDVLIVIYDKVTYGLFPKSLGKIGTKALDLFFSHPRYIKKIKINEKIISKELLKLIKFPVNKLFRNKILVSSGETRVRKILKYYQEYAYFVDTLGFLFQVYYVKKFRKHFFDDLEGFSLIKKENFFNFILSSSQKTNYEKFLFALYKYFISGQREKDFKIIVNHFYWLIHDYLGEIIDKKYIKNQTKEIKKKSIREFRKELLEVEVRVEKIKEIKKQLNKKTLLRIKLLQELLYLYNERKKETLNKVNIFLRRMAEHKLSTKNIDRVHLFFQYSPEEIIKFLKAEKFKLSPKRNESWVYKMREGKINNGDLKYLKLATNFNRIKILKGISASLGKIKGRVSVILNISHIHKFKTGRILVAPFTNVNYLPIMRKASAILTETGGLTCHAAIVARELKIPCVAGVRNILGNLKDDDLIEVDADNGIIRKIK